MPDAALMSQMESHFSAVVEQILETMCFAGVMGEVEAETAQPTLTEAARVSYRGPSEGAVVVSCGGNGARALAASFLGEDEVSPEQVTLFVGELANMICGALVSRLEVPGQYSLVAPVATSPDSLSQATGLRRDFELEDGYLTVTAEQVG